MENTWKRLLSFAIALVMVIGMMPGQVFAAEATGEPVAQNDATVTLPAGVTAESFGTNTVTDGTAYYATLEKAVKAVYGVENTVLYCKPGANVGQMTHGPVKANLTVYGNGAYTSGNGDFAIGNVNGIGQDIASDVTLTVQDLDGCGAWGNKATAHTVNLVFENCKNMTEVYLTGTGGVLNISLTDCEFTGNAISNCKVYSNANGAVTLTRVAFANVDKAVNLNHKVAGEQIVTLTDCTFTDCGNNVASDEIPVRVLSSVEGGKSNLTVSGCTFTGTVAGGADILVDKGTGTTVASISSTAANVTVEKSTGEVVNTTTTATQSTTVTNVTIVNNVASVNGAGYATLKEAVEAATEGQTVTLLADVTLTGGYAEDAEAGLYIDKDVTIDGQGLYTIDCGSFVKGIRIYDGTVKLQNLTVVNAKAKGRCVDTRSNVDLTLENVTLKTTSRDNNQTLTIGGNDHGTKVTLIDTTIEAGVAGYAIINFVKSQVEIQNSTITGYGALYFKEGSAGAEFNVTNSTLNGENVHNNPAANSFAAITFEEDGVELNVTGGAINVTATGNAGSTAFALGNAIVPNVQGVEVNVSESTTIQGKLMSGKNLEDNTVILPAACADQLVSEGVMYAPVVGQDGQISVTGEALFAIGTTQYASLAAALADATAGQTVKLVRDVDMSGEVITLFKGITLDLNGYTLTALGVSAFKGDMVIDSGNAEGRKTGALKVSKDMLILPTNNAQIPVWNGVDGYQFATMNMTQFRFAAGYTGTGFKVEAKPAFGDAAEKTFAKEYFTDGAADNGIQILIRLTGTTTSDDTVKQDYVFNEEMIKQVYGTSGTAFGLTVGGLSNIATVKIEMIVIANDTIQSVSEPLTYTAE